MPKSVSTAWSSRPSSTLLGLTSRCITPAACATLSADSSWRPTSAARRGDSGPEVASTWSSDWALTSCITIQGRPPVLGHVVDGHHARVVEPGGRLGLAQRPLVGVGPFLGGERLRDLDFLDRDVTVEQLIAGTPHDPHGTAANGSL